MVVPVQQNTLPRSPSRGVVGMRLQGRTALITGATRGIGAVLAKRFAEHGAQVAIVGRSADLGKKVAAEIRETGGRAAFIRCDVSVEGDIAAAVTATVENFGHLDVLVNNAGPTDLLFDGTERPVEELSTESLDKILRIGLYGPLWCCKYAIPHMRRAGGGSIINMASMAALTGLPGAPSYTIAKGALTALSRQLAVDYGSDGIRCNTIVLGLIIHETTAAVVATPEAAATFRSMQLTRLGTPDDVAYIAIYLASQESQFVTGSTVTVDGGALVKAPQPTNEMFVTINQNC
jgi:meso-butanediol dehydrogenase / (S,S)-butanediol dehydrogenase / diacetyl reductase